MQTIRYMNDYNVKCIVEVSHLALGNRKGHEEEKTYREGDTLIIPFSLAETLGKSVRIIAKTGGKKGKAPDKK